MGCLHRDLLESGDTTLPTECYICEPTANGVVVDNGICDRAANENCQNSPDECGIVGYTCSFPGSATPGPAPSGLRCETFGGPSSQTTYVTPACEDGDRCTDDICTVNLGQPTGTPGTCSHDEKVCDPTSDGCCPTGCTGPHFGTTCDEPNAPANCDPDCCAPEVCGNGDSEVQPPETCDDSVPSGEAGIKPNGQAVTLAECRDPGTTDQCTYCGDGIFQPASEECDLSAQVSCTQGGTCDPVLCTCSRGVGCFQGSGMGNNSGLPDCDGWTGCSLNKNATASSTQGWGLLLLAGAGFVLALGLRKRAE